MAEKGYHVRTVHVCEFTTLLFLITSKSGFDLNLENNLKIYVNNFFIDYLILYF
jgi:HSP90 family molecular chaperone